MLKQLLLYIKKMETDTLSNTHARNAGSLNLIMNFNRPDETGWQPVETYPDLIRGWSAGAKNQWEGIL